MQLADKQTPVSKQRLGKHVNNTGAIARQLLAKRFPTATDTHATIVLLDCKNGNGVFYVVKKVKLSLCLIKHYAMKAYGGVDFLCGSCRNVVSRVNRVQGGSYKQFS
jgi:hypothetical protein